MNESEFDAYTERNHHGAYAEAYKKLGITPEDIVIDGGDNPVVEPLNQSRIGANVRLAERAMHLLEVIRSNSKASQLKGFNEASKKSESINRRYSRNDILRIGRAEVSNKNAGDNEFYEAYGSLALRAAGFSVVTVNYNAQLESEDFRAKLAGPSNRAKREKYKRVLLKQQNW